MSDLIEKDPIEPEQEEMEKRKLPDPDPPVRTSPAFGPDDDPGDIGAAGGPASTHI